MDAWVLDELRRLHAARFRIDRHDDRPVCALCNDLGWAEGGTSPPRYVLKLWWRGDPGRPCGDCGGLSVWTGLTSDPLEERADLAYRCLACGARNEVPLACGDDVEGLGRLFARRLPRGARPTYLCGGIPPNDDERFDLRYADEPPSLPEPRTEAMAQTLFEHVKSRYFPRARRFHQILPGYVDAAHPDGSIYVADVRWQSPEAEFRFGIALALAMGTTGAEKPNDRLLGRIEGVARRALVLEDFELRERALSGLHSLVTGAWLP